VLHDRREEARGDAPRHPATPGSALTAMGPQAPAIEREGSAGGWASYIGCRNSRSACKVG